MAVTVVTYFMLGLIGLRWLENCSVIGLYFQIASEFKLAKFLQLIGTIKRTIFKKVRTETILKI